MCLNNGVIMLLYELCAKNREGTGSMKKWPPVKRGLNQGWVDHLYYLRRKYHYEGVDTGRT